ncbi:peptidoglycan D,D-transpeptidase FtsI family protein [Aquibacillus kalidii]|uniref:peptidoglycan D,D-transpeptidase FtsI family protein n=1 Tax=Aquibacillus kalidii TaxID=2762597 RepID=UPI0016440650|nr:penicillin-binding protein 2 [Aquibacillus kalidii]
MGDKKKKKKSQLPFRLNILFIFVFGLFSLLILQLGVVQILNGEEAQNEINKTENTPSTKPVPRGKMYDRFGRIVLDNEPVKAITYTPPKNGESAAKRLELAENLAQYVTMFKDREELLDNIKERDKKEYWYLQNAKVVQERLTKKEKELDNSEQYKVMLDKITDKDLQEIEWTDELLNVIAIKKEFDQAFELSPHVVLNEGITEEEFAQVAEHLPELQGINAAIDWKRKPLYGGTFNSFIGGITTSDKGIPLENRDYYLTHGYSLNDRVGTSGLEQQYESVLRGRKEKVQYTTDNSGNVVGSEIVVQGKSGNDLVLTLDMELQQAVDKIVQEELKTAMGKVNNNGYLEDALVAMMNPQTGEILAMSGVRYDREDNEYKDQSYRVIYDAHQPGSAVKGATLLAGFDSGVVHIGETIRDTAIKIAGTPKKESWTNLGNPSDLKAIERSSNVYMFNIALRMSGASYQYNQPLRGFDWDSFQRMRNYFNQFGLGVETGVDLPYEATGVVGQDTVAGKILDLAIGQYDTYTTLQLVQYVSTIANDGYRIRPHLVNEIRQAEPQKGQLGPVVKSFNTEVLNKIGIDDKYIERVKQGFINVFHGSQGTAAGRWSGEYRKYKVAGKTGTAENPQYEDGKMKAYTENLSLVGYAPYDNPEVAFAIVVPKNGGGNTQYAVHHEIGKKIIAKYFELKDERAKNGVDTDLLSDSKQEEDGQTKEE